MSKKFIQDVVSRNNSHDDGNERQDFEVHHHHRHKRKGIMTAFYVLISSIFVIGIFVAISSTYSNVVVKVTTTKKDVSVNDSVILTKDGLNGALKYDIMALDATESGSLPVSGTKNVQTTAVGSVTIYNSYSKSTQTLVSGTRLQTKDGLIYKIEKTVNVPGIYMTGDKTFPGSIDVSVRASQPGQKYNIPPSDFTIPGFSNSPKFLKITAHSKNNISGGFIGEVKTATQASIDEMRSRLQDTIKQKLTQKALLQAPKDMIVFNDAMTINFTDNAINNSIQVDTDSKGTNLTVKGTLNAILISINDLKKLIIKNDIGSAGKDANIVLSGMNDLNFKIANKDKLNLSLAPSISATIQGNLTAVWDFDTDALKAKLIGIKKSNYQEMFKEFNVIEKAEAIFTPSWAFSFPNDPSRIEIDKNFIN